MQEKSPAQKLYGHPVQDSLPAHRYFAPEWQGPVNNGHTSKVLQKAESFYNQHAHPLPDLALGAHVAVQKSVSKARDINGVVTAVNPHCRYLIVRRQSTGPQPTFPDSYISPCTGVIGNSVPQK